jgi:hypothetical protein
MKSYSTIPALTKGSSRTVFIQTGGWETSALTPAPTLLNGSLSYVLVHMYLYPKKNLVLFNVFPAKLFYAVIGRNASKDCYIEPTYFLMTSSLFLQYIAPCFSSHHWCRNFHKLSLLLSIFHSLWSLHLWAAQQLTWNLVASNQDWRRTPS